MKRFTETTKWEDPWFRKLSCKHKSLWLYLCDKCDNAGVWKIDLELASFQIGEGITRKDMENINLEKERIIIKENLVIVKEFIPFQIGDLKKDKLTNLQKNCLILLDNYVKKGIYVTGSLPVSYPIATRKLRVTSKGKGKGKGDNILNNNINVGYIEKKCSDDEFLKKLERNIAYKDINIEVELGKMDSWLLANPGRKKTREFIVRWLNKVDIPVKNSSNPKKKLPPKQLEIPKRENVNAEEIKKINDLVQGVVKKCSR